MPIRVNEAIDTDTAELVFIERIEAGSYVDGLFQDGATLPLIKTLASVQQPTPKQLENLPSGEKTRNVMAFYPLKPVYTADEEAKTPADVIRHKGNRFKVVFAGDWDSYGFTFALGAQIK